MFEECYTEYTLPLKGERISSYKKAMEPPEEVELTDEEKKILECIPQYPHTATLQDLSDKTNIPRNIISSKLHGARLTMNFPLCDITPTTWCLVPKEALA